MHGAAMPEAAVNEHGSVDDRHGGTPTLEFLGNPVVPVKRSSAMQAWLEVSLSPRTGTRPSFRAVYLMGTLRPSLYSETATEVKQGGGLMSEPPNQGAAERPDLVSEHEILPARIVTLCRRRLGVDRTHDASGTPEALERHRGVISRARTP